MRLVKVGGLVTLGFVIGIGTMAAGGKVTAQAPSGRMTIAGPSVEWASSYPFRFVRDTKTMACYVISLSPDGRATTGIARAEDTTACTP